MNNVRLPNEIYGKWIWKQSLLNHPDGFALLRREFSCSRIGEDVTMWVTAVNCYQLFLNGRLVGFGPRAHQIGNAVFIDQFSLGDYVENGVNVITVSPVRRIMVNRNANRASGVSSLPAARIFCAAMKSG